MPYSLVKPLPPWHCSGGVDRLDAGVGGCELGHVGKFAGLAALIEDPGRLERHQRRHLDVGARARQRMLQSLIGADRHIVEDPALADVVDRAVQRVAAETAADRTDQDPLRIEALEQDAEPLVDLADDIFRPQIDVVEEQLPLGFRRRNADRNVLFLKSLRLQIDDEQRKAVGFLLGFALRRGARHHQRMVGAVGVGDERLLAVEGEAVAALLRHRRGADGVAAGVGLGDRKAEAGLAACRHRADSAPSAASEPYLAMKPRLMAAPTTRLSSGMPLFDNPSRNRCISTMPWPAPPYCSGTMVPTNPSSAIRWYKASGKTCLLGAFHPVFAIELLRDQIAIFQDLPLLVRKIKVHASAPSPPPCGHRAVSVADCRGPGGRGVGIRHL